MSDTSKTYHQSPSEVVNIINNFTMSASMPVISCDDNLFQNEKELHRFLLNYQEKFPEKGKKPIVSFSQKIDLIDPLAVLHTIVKQNQLHFYWENRNKKEAIAGYEITKHITIKSPDRFSKAQHFIQNCLQQIIKTGDLHLPGSGPYFFCNFSFFESQENKDSPFPDATIFLPRFQINCQKDYCILITNIAIEEKINLQFISEQIKHQIQLINWSNSSFITQSFEQRTNIKTKAKAHNSHQFKSAVASVLKSIHSKKFSKIVLAHALDVISPVPFDLIKSLNKLRQNHPDCYIFSISNGKGHNFIGASPERLISINNQQLVTDALAGSAPRGKTVDEDTYLANRLLKSEKERREHQAVSLFILQNLQKLNLKPHQSPLKLLQLSNIQHLWTPIYAHLPANINPLNIVAQLHPTPAVAGVPTKIACEQIQRYETFDRTLYAAPIGWLDYQGNSEFIVGIRSALIKDNQARLYAGAGIVAGSDPDKEFAEVQLKLQSLLKALV